MCLKWLHHPLTRGLDIDDPRTTVLRRRIIQGKGFLRRIYEEWYRAIVSALPPGQGRVLELGSGAGFLRDYLPDLITSEVFVTPDISLVLDASGLPFADNSLKAIVMTNVLHHIARPRRFFAEATRCVHPGGAVVMVEPWITSWSLLVYRHLHHEPIDPEARHWEFPARGPLSGANVALPWIMFSRDRSRFELEFPMWHIRTIQPFMPFRYLLSGGVSFRAFMPGWTFALWRIMENCLPWMDSWAMFALICLVRKH